MLQHQRAKGDTLSLFAVQLTNDGTPVNLTGKTVKFNMFTLAGTQVVTNGTVAVTGATTGEVQYDFQAADVLNAGVFKAWFTVFDGSETDNYPPDDDGIQVTIFDRAADTTPEDPAIDIVALANAPARTRTVEGTVEERSVNELIKADQYTKGTQAADVVPWGLRLARTKPGGMTT